MRSATSNRYPQESPQYYCLQDVYIPVGEAGAPGAGHVRCLTPDGLDLNDISGNVHYEGGPGTTIRQWTVIPDTIPNIPRAIPVDLTADGNPLPTGYYHVTWSVPGADSWRSTDQRIAVVDRHLTLKVGADESLVWVTDLRSAQPIPGADIRLLSRTGVVLGQGTTDAVQQRLPYHI